jgi:hypothetical protein
LLIQFASFHHSDCQANSIEDCRCTIPLRNPEIPVATADSKENA